MAESTAVATIDEVTHHVAQLNGTSLHYVAAGTQGSPILLVHGFPESWWAFHELIPLLAANHRVFAVDLRGFGDSEPADDEFSSAVAADDLHHLIAHLGVGPVHVTGQDIAGATVFRLAMKHPEDVASLTAIEMGLPGFGLETLADVTQGGSWHIGMLAARGVAGLLLAGRERAYLQRFAFEPMTMVPGAIGEADLDEFTRVHSRPGGWSGAAGLYRSMLAEGDEFRALVGDSAPMMPVLAVDAGGAPFTVTTMSGATRSAPAATVLEGVGHYVALEAPERLAAAIEEFVVPLDR